MGITKRGGLRFGVVVVHDGSVLVGEAQFVGARSVRGLKSIEQASLA
jgi:hypothetical protein